METYGLWSLAIVSLLAFVASFGYYMLFVKVRRQLSPAGAAAASRPRPEQILLELGRNVVLALAVSYLLRHLGITGQLEAMHLALLLWLAFPVMILAGSVMWERVPVKLAALHSGDWLIKLMLMALFLARWQ